MSTPSVPKIAKPPLSCANGSLPAPWTRAYSCEKTTIVAATHRIKSKLLS
jgi:hypothetical protein